MERVQAFLPPPPSPPPPPSASFFGSFLSVPCPHPGVMQSRFAILKKEQLRFPQKCFPVSQRSMFDGKRAGSGTSDLLCEALLVLRACRRDVREF